MEQDHFLGPHRRALAGGRPGLLGLIVPKASDPFILELTHSWPALTSAVISPSEVARTALNAIRTDSAEPVAPRTIAIRSKLAIHESTRFPRGAMMDLPMRQKPMRIAFQGQIRSENFD